MYTDESHKVTNYFLSPCPPTQQQQNGFYGDGVCPFRPINMEQIQNSSGGGMGKGLLGTGSKLRFKSPLSARKGLGNQNFDSSSAKGGPTQFTTGKDPVYDNS
jgi:hypothetical protein